MAKQYASDIALEVTNDALQIFGGTGYLKGMDVERMLKTKRKIAAATASQKETMKESRLNVVRAEHFILTAKRLAEYTTRTIATPIFAGELSRNVMCSA